MPKRTNFVPNLRVDIGDLDNATHVYPRSVLKNAFKQFLQDRFPRVAAGFRVEIADQGASPGQFTVHNGLALDRDGQLLVNEDEANAQRTQTLVGDATYYIEIEFTTEESDTDSRAFWDPTFDNGVDASGDVLPDGREFAQLIATRVSEDWQIVSPISTSGFAISTDRNSTRVPVAILTVSGGVISGPAATTPARSILRSAVSAGAVSLQLVNSRLFLDAGDIQLDPGGPNDETVTVTGNDRVNGVLTVTPTANAHDVGERVVDAAGTPLQFVEERTTYEPVIPSTDGDARPMLFQGNADAGYALSQDPYNDPGQSDLQIGSLKEYVDFLAAQIRELKFGSAITAEIGNTPPPSAFTAAPQHYDLAGSLQGARAYTVSVGDGVTSWGDFNTLQSGSAQAALQAAHDALPSAGGTIFIKSGTYTITNTNWTITKGVRIVGAGRNVTVIDLTGTGWIDLQPAVDQSLAISNLSIARTAGSAIALAVTSWASSNRLNVQDCSIDGFQCTVADLHNAAFYDVLFNPGAAFGPSFEGGVWNSSFRSCTFINEENANSATAYKTGAASTSSNVKFYHCKFELAAATAGDWVVTMESAAPEFHFVSCTFTGGDDGTKAFFVGNNCDYLVIRDCTSDTVGGLAYLGGTDYTTVEGCTVLFATATGGQSAIYAASTAAQCKILNNKFQASTPGTSALHAAIVIGGTGNHWFITGNEFTGCEYGILVTSAIAVGYTVANNKYVNSLVASGVAFIHHSGATSNQVASWIIEGNYVIGCTHSGQAEVNAIWLKQTNKVSIRGNVINNIGSSSSSVTTAGGIYLNGTASDVSINGNIVQQVTTNDDTGTVRGIYLNGSAERLSINDNTINSLSFGVGRHARGVELDLNANSSDVTVNSNAITEIGGNTGTNTDLYGIWVDGNAAQVTRVSISKNTIGQILVNAAGTHACIRLTTSVRDVVISGNNLDVTDNLVAGIYCNSTDAAVEFMRNYAITGNVIEGPDISPAEWGIQVECGETTGADVEGSVAVSGNTIWGMHGIQLKGPSSTEDSANGTIIGNTVKSMEITGGAGCHAYWFDKVSIVGNTIELGGTGACQGISIFQCDPYVITGNYVHCVRDAAAQTGTAIDTGGAAGGGIVAGNYAHGYSSGAVIDLDTNCFAGVNRAVQSGAGVTLDAGDNTRARRNDANNNATLDPTGNTDIGLNWVI